MLYKYKIMSLYYKNTHKTKESLFRLYRINELLKDQEMSVLLERGMCDIVCGNVFFFFGVLMRGKCKRKKERK